VVGILESLTGVENYLTANRIDCGILTALSRTLAGGRWHSVVVGVEWIVSSYALAFERPSSYYECPL